MTLDDYVRNGDYASLYVLARYFYRIGEPIIDDAIYENVQNVVKATSPHLQAYFDRTYDDDPVPTELLATIGVQPVVFLDLRDKGELFAYLDEEKSNSIEPVVSYEKAFNYFSFLRSSELDFVASLKMDGNNTKMLYVDSEFALSVSRGRNGTAFDFTEKSAKVVPRFIPTKSKYTKIIGESYVETEALEYLRNKYNKKKYKTSKSAAISMLRVQHDAEDYKYLKTRVFYVDGLADTLHETFQILQDNGVDTTPYLLFSWRDIPVDFDEFSKWLKSEVLDKIYELGMGIPSDGVVIEVDDLLWEGTQKNQYSNRQLALKFEQWGFKYAKGIITDIQVEQRRVYKSVRIQIMPVITYDGCEARYINSFDPSILIQNELYVGKEVYFERNSGAVNILIHGERLKALKASESDCVEDVD